MSSTWLLVLVLAVCDVIGSTDQSNDKDVGHIVEENGQSLEDRLDKLRNILNEDKSIASEPYRVMFQGSSTEDLNDMDSGDDETPESLDYSEKYINALKEDKRMQLSSFYGSRGKKDAEEQYSDYLNGQDDVDAYDMQYADKRMAPSGFFGARGKKMAPSGFFGARGKKMAPSGFFGARGKKMSDAFFGVRGKKMAPSGFFGARGKKMAADAFFGARGKKMAPSGFFGARGKKMAPSGFIGARGKKLSDAFFGVRGKKMSDAFFGVRGKKMSASNFYGSRGKRDSEGYGEIWNEYSDSRLSGPSEAQKRQARGIFHATRG